MNSVTIDKLADGFSVIERENCPVKTVKINQKHFKSLNADSRFYKSSNVTRIVWGAKLTICKKLNNVVLIGKKDSDTYEATLIDDKWNLQIKRK